MRYDLLNDQIKYLIQVSESNTTELTRIKELFDTVGVDGDLDTESIHKMLYKLYMTNKSTNDIIATLLLQLN